MKNMMIISVAMLVAGSAMADIYSEDFSTPTKQSNSGANGYLGTGGTGYNYNGNFGTWLYAGNNMGVNDAAQGLGDGSSDGNAISSIGMARIQDERGSNARALSVILSNSLFTDGVEYTVSFDVIGDAGGGNAGRYWLAEVYDYDNTGSNFIQIDGTHNGWGAGAGTPKPFTANGTATVNYLKDSASNGVLISGENAEGTTTVEFTFTYDDANSADIALAVGTYNNIFGIDNVTVVPEPATLGLVAAFGTSALFIRRLMM